MTTFERSIGLAIEHLSAALPHSDSDGRPDGLADELEQLLRASTAAEREAAWDRFVHRYSRLILHTVHSRANGYDDAMDRYAFVLGALRERDYRRLRRFEAASGARFSTWLVVVVGRLCIDYHRKRYGATESSLTGCEHDWRNDVRRRLADLVSAKLDLRQVSDPRAPRPDASVRESELRENLERAVAILDPRDRWLLRLRFHDGLPAREIADLMHFPTLFHVYRRVNSVLGSLRETLEDRGITDARP